MVPWLWYITKLFGSSYSINWRFFLITSRLVKNCRKRQENRVAFAQLCKEKLQEKPTFLKRFALSDDCSLPLHGEVEKQNCRNCGTQRPEIVYESPQTSPTLMDWGTSSENEVIGPSLLKALVIQQISTILFRSSICFQRLLITLPTRLLNRIPVPRTTQLQPDNIWTKRFEIDARGGEDGFSGLLDLLTWPVCLLSVG